MNTIVIILSGSYSINNNFIILSYLYFLLFKNKFVRKFFGSLELRATTDVIDK